MPVTVSYPGVYIEEIPSGVHTITGVATSIAAFVGWAPAGAIDQAELVLSWQDYARSYGGLDARSKLGYAVSQFFANGGSQAYIIRLVFKDAVAANTSLSVSGGTSPSVVITAANPGAWGNNYGILIKNQVVGGTATGRFRLQVAYAPSGASPTVVESFENLSLVSPDPGGRYLADILAAQSNYVTATITGSPTSFPSDITTPQMLGTGTGNAVGADGTVLAPSSPGTQGNFENALLPTSGTGGVHFLEHVDLFNLLCIPGLVDPATIGSLETFCRQHRAFMIVDCDSGDTVSSLQKSGGPNSSMTGADGINAAFYFPWINAPDPLNQGGIGPFPPCGFVAGIYASTDGSRGVWKAPAGTQASLSGVIGTAITLNDADNGLLNPVAVNCIRTLAVYGTVVWGTRTLQGNDEIGSEWKYVPVRRLALYIEESLYRGTKWAVFEPNDEPLWSQLRLNVGAFMHDLFRKGAFQGQSPKDAYFVKCDSETTTQSDINLGIVNVLVGFAPLKPAEFVIIQIQQMAGQIAS